jgi:hypothetical protein
MTAEILPFPAPVKHRCKCCQRGYTAAEWAALQLKGYSGYFFAGGRRYACEMRQCSTDGCTNTLAMEVELPGVVPQTADEMVDLLSRSIAAVKVKP